MTLTDEERVELEQLRSEKEERRKLFEYFNPRVTVREDVRPRGAVGGAANAQINIHGLSWHVRSTFMTLELAEQAAKELRALMGITITHVEQQLLGKKEEPRLDIFEGAGVTVDPSTGEMSIQLKVPAAENKKIEIPNLKEYLKRMSEE